MPLQETCKNRESLTHHLDGLAVGALHDEQTLLSAVHSTALHVEEASVAVGCHEAADASGSRSTVVPYDVGDVALATTVVDALDTHFSPALNNPRCKGTKKTKTKSKTRENFSYVYNIMQKKCKSEANTPIC